MPAPTPGPTAPEATAPEATTPGGGSGDDAPAPPSRDNQGLFLDVVLNSAPLQRLGFFVLVQGRLHATTQTLEELGLGWPAEAEVDGRVALDAIAGVTVRYDEPGQRVYIDVPVALLQAPPTPIGYRTPPAPRLDPATRAPGLLFNYSLWAQGNHNARSASSWQELRLFGVGPGVWRSSGLLTASDSGESGGNGSVRLDTSWQLDFPEPMVTVVFGDTVSQGLEWTRSTRFGGVRVSRNFGLQPYRVTVPLASFAGEAVLPSTVDLYIDGIRQARQDVMPGRFQIDSAPVLSGLGNAQVVVTDITGQSRVVDFSIYNARQLLQAGLSDWSFEAGALRRDYGLRSFEYASQPMASASLRHGATGFLTVEAHLEGMRALEMGGVGAMLRLGRAGGVLSGSWARSRYDRGGEGKQYGFGYEWQGHRLSLGMATLRRDDDFRDVASLEGAVLPLRSDRVFAGLNLGRAQLGVGYVRQDMPDDGTARYTNASWSQRLSPRLHLSLGASRDLDGDTGTLVFLSLGLWWDEDADRQAWLRAQRRDGGQGMTVGVARPLPADADGWGWRAQVGAGDDAGGQAEVGRTTRHGQWNAGVLAWHGSGGPHGTAYFNASGGVLWMRGGLFPMRRVHDAFALVSTDGIGGVPVLLENRHVGETDARGLLLVTPLNAWQENSLAIDPLVLPADVSVARTKTLAVPATGSGMLVRFPMRATVSVRLALRGIDGKPVPAGAALELLAADGAATPVASVGYDGQVFLQDPPAQSHLRATWPEGRCEAEVPASLPARGWVEAGELPCR